LGLVIRLNQAGWKVAVNMKCIQHIGRIVILSGLLGACSQVSDQRQVVQGPSFGLSGYGKVVEVLVAQDGNSFGPQRFERVSENGGFLATAVSVSADNELVSFISAFVGSLAAAIVGEAESKAREKRCLYFIELEDENIKSSLQSNILISSGFQGPNPLQVDPGYILTPDGDLLMESDATAEQINWYFEQIQNQKTTNASSDAPVVLPQSCDPDILPGSDVLVTFFNWGGTIHPRNSALTTN